MQKSNWSVFGLTLHHFKNFCRMKLVFYSCSPMKNCSKKPPFEKIFFGKGGLSFEDRLEEIAKDNRDIF